MITGIHHINLVVQPGTLAAAAAFYGETLGLTARPVPAAQAGTLAWFDVGPPSASQQQQQQVHIAFGEPEDFAFASRRHPCFRVGSGDELLELRRRIHAHFERGGEGAPLAADKPGEESSGAKGVEYPQRFFARDYAGNRL
ncbi:putative glyoxalase family protein [Eutypa lata UCREL1]|uniref:Putative glyoxalase family protein n=1 Tax=Eutypa lata (strain UCR-EL1) TaxID=1287681 RepID=M7U1M6_EUTLA|nr:putative glyoxalase family protein [Eutypa lata UCREL1]